MDVQELLSDFQEFARVAAGHEDVTVLLLLEAAAGDVAQAAGVELPEDAAELPGDLRLAILDTAARAYDGRGDNEGRPGLTVTASRIVARYRGVSLGTAAAAGDG